MKNIIEEILKEASLNGVVIDDVEFPIFFNSEKYIKDDILPTLEIKNEELFLRNLAHYNFLVTENLEKQPVFIKEKEKNLIKLISTYSFCNFTTEEFKNPENALQRKINFLNDITFKDFSIETDMLKISNEKQSVYMETPYKINISINDLDLPSISYGIENETCYIYSILMPKNKLEETTKAKKMKRELYKLNKNVPEDQKNVSPSAVLSLTIFLKLLEEKNIKNVKAVTYLPVRYSSRELGARNRQDLIDRNQLIQENITNKFINTILRCNFHTDMIKIKSYPYEQDEFLSFNLKEEAINNDLLINIINELNRGKIK